ncbi:MAG: hypothetical protein P1V51_10050 [Deltaproteobacteria bacterium]|nr:hypothetical protein [Deltaproteobacteria bacterium]
MTRIASSTAALLLGLALVAGAGACGEFDPGDEVLLFEVVPQQVPVGASAELRGQNLGETQGAGWVTLAGAPAPVQAWAPDRILVEVPQVGPGEVLVVVNWPDHRTEPVALTVLP